MKQIIETTRSILNNRRSLAIFAGLYALLLATLYGFIATREAKVWQVLLTLFFVACAPVIFFVLQAVIINCARHGKIEWYATLLDSCKLALLALPLILIGWGISYLLNRWQLHFPVPRLAPQSPLTAAAGQAAATPPTHWPSVLFATARVLIFVFVLPLTMIQLWVQVGKENLLAFFRSGPRPVFKSLGQTLARAFAPQSVLVYSLGLILFALIPYVLLFLRVTMGGTKREFAVFTFRLALVFVFTLFGWVLMLSAFAQANDSYPPTAPPPVVDSPIEAGPEPRPSTTVAA